MFKAKLSINAGDIATIIGLNEDPRHLLYGPTLDSVFDRAKEIVAQVKFEAKPDRIPEVQIEVDKILAAFKEDLDAGKVISYHETKFDPYDELNAFVSWSAEPYSKFNPIVEILTPKTPASKWFETGEEDPHAKRFTDVERSSLAMGSLTDDQLANAVFVHNHREMDLNAMLAGEPSSIALLTAAKERIRWLSRKTLWPVNKVTVIGDDEVTCKLADNAGTAEFFKAVLNQMEWNCLRDGKFEDDVYTAFDVAGIIVDEKSGETEAVSVHDPRVTQWAIYGRLSETTAIALHDSDSLDEALTRVMVLAKIYQ